MLCELHNDLYYERCYCSCIMESSVILVLLPKMQFKSLFGQSINIAATMHFVDTEVEILMCAFSFLQDAARLDGGRRGFQVYDGDNI